jgi:Heparinase II/III-like protein/Heparinase II/III N-terminus
MSPGEVAWRLREQALRRAWARRQVRAGQGADPGAVATVPPGSLGFKSVLPVETADQVAVAARQAVVNAADELLAGQWEMLGVVRTDMAQPDWFADPVTGVRSDPGRYAFSINQRSEAQVGNIKQVWEVNRLQHLTLLAAAWRLTGEDAYAERVATQLRDWWRRNPFLSGVNWTSGIEVGVRLMNFAWIRRLLDGWPGAPDLFEHSDLASRQIRWHQEYLAAFESRGSSANNHLVAEAAGQLAASCAFPWFPQSARWRERSAALLERALRDNTFASGINRELASDYHGFVFELGIFAAAEAAAAGTPLSEDTMALLCAMADAMAAVVDVRCQPPRQGDSDEGRVVLLDAPAHNRWPELLALADAVYGRLDWWPPVPTTAGGVLLGGMLEAPVKVVGRPSRRPSRWPDAGITLLRTDRDDLPEIWCRCDGGPHGFLSIAAHAHADALSVEARYDGVEILADPGTYCYHGEPEWRSYFRSTRGHNTAEIAGCSQSAESGPFMWQRQARTREIDAAEASWTAEHDGYARLAPAARHRRSVRLDEAERRVEITDAIDGAGHEVLLAFHLGPDVTAELRAGGAFLAWSAASGDGAARLELPGDLDWGLHRGETDPILGWYSPGLGRRVPAFAIVGRGRWTGDRQFVTNLLFSDNGQWPAILTSGQIVE